MSLIFEQVLPILNFLCNVFKIMGSLVKLKLKYMCIATREIMDCMFEAYSAQERCDPNDIIPRTKEPVYILGKRYDATTEIHKIRQDILSRVWITYRRGFVPIGNPEGPTSDRGWGCMLRCGQMLLCEALISTHLGRDWMWEEESRDPTYLKILKKFEDSRQEPFSIHQIALMGVSEGKEVGEWFGPNTVSQVLKKLLKYDQWCSVTIHVALDNVIVINEIKNRKWVPLVLVVPLRLGLTEINPIYVNGLKTVYKFKQSLGIIGGTPNHALYFIGCVGDDVIYLDPHTTQQSGFVRNKETEEQIAMDMTYHCRRAQKMRIVSMDPSIALCFYCKTEDDFNDLITLFQEELIKSEKQPLFEISLDKPKQYTTADFDLAQSIGFHNSSEFSSGERNYDSENEFEIL